MSCLISWVNNDYGNGEISKALFGSAIPDEQIKSAERTQVLVEEADALTEFGLVSEGKRIRGFFAALRMTRVCRCG